MKRSGAWVGLKCTLVTRRLNAQERDEHTKHECLNSFAKRRGAWSSLKRSLVTRLPNAQEENKHTKHKWMEKKQTHNDNARVPFYKIGFLIKRRKEMRGVTKWQLLVIHELNRSKETNGAK